MDLKKTGTTREGRRLREAEEGVAPWKRWGPYVSERAWGTVREDYSPHGTAWDYFPHDQARSRAYRWSEDGLAGLCDEHQRVCFALALWNGADPILKERLFGLNNTEGNHGEDVKEYYFYLDSTPTHSWMRYLYRYPQAAYPYAKLIEENRRRGRLQPEYELIDTGVFDGGRFFDVFVEYAKAGAEDILIEIQVINRGPEVAPIHVLPTIWFRNRWSWDASPKPSLQAGRATSRWRSIEIDDVDDGPLYLHAQAPDELLFTENESNAQRLWGTTNPTPFVKDAFHEYVVHGRVEAVNPALRGTKAAAVYARRIGPGETVRIRLRLSRQRRAPAGGRKRARPAGADPLGAEFDRLRAQRRSEADEFFDTVIPTTISEDARQVARQALGGLLWSKQYYHFEVRQWLLGDPAQAPPAPERHRGRNARWQHLHNADVMSVPDKWEFPWYASWDLAFHCVVLALVDPAFAKQQIRLLLREWYMHPNGQIPAYEWSFDDVNPPLHAWAAMRVYQMDRLRTGKADTDFLEAAFHKLLLNFNWWVNRKDLEGDNVFEGGFLGLDNIGIFDRNAALPPGYILGQSDGTSWMAMYCLNLLNIAIELAGFDDVYEDVAVKFWEHFFYIARAMYRHGDGRTSLWDEEDGFFYDVLREPSGAQHPVRVRSIVGLIPLLATAAFESKLIDRYPSFEEHIRWFTAHHPDLAESVSIMRGHGKGERALLSVVRPEQLQRLLRIMLDEDQFLSPHGIRSVSRAYRDQPYRFELGGRTFTLAYEPAESRSDLFGGNSNWRGPVWMPLNYLLIEALQRFSFYFGEEYQVECPTGSGKMMDLEEVTVELSRRLCGLYLRQGGRRAVLGDREVLQNDPLWRDYLPFHEYFDGDTGAGLGASHQTGWTALVAKLLQQSGAIFSPAAPARRSGARKGIRRRKRPKTAPAPRKRR